MPRFSPPVRPPAAPPPDGVVVELVDLLYGNLQPVAALGAVITTIGAVIAIAEGDLATSLLTLACGLVTIGRVLSIQAYRRAAADSPPTSADARAWDRRYATGSLALAGLLGALFARTCVMNDPLVGMAVAGLLLGYALGMVAGVSIRPATCLASLALAIAPPILAFGAHLVVTGVYPVAAIVAAQAFLIAALATTTFAAVRHVHDAILRQLLAERELAALSGRDSLTGLPNRSLLRVRFAEAVSRLGETGEILAIHCLDLDHFQAVNDSLGRPAGDALLQAVAERLARALRAEDTAARMSGDEFVVIQTAIRDADQALLLAERIIETIGARYQIDGREVEIGVSFGIALAPRDGIDLDQLTSRADTALHQAKREKRPVVFWGEGAERGGAAPAARERLVVTGLD